MQANYYASLANSSWLTQLATLIVTEHTSLRILRSFGVGSPGSIVFTQERKK
jgi:hypothetical protein